MICCRFCFKSVVAVTATTSTTRAEICEACARLQASSGNRQSPGPRPHRRHVVRARKPRPSTWRLNEARCSTPNWTPCRSGLWAEAGGQNGKVESDVCACATVAQPKYRRQERRDSDRYVPKPATSPRTRRRSQPPAHIHLRTTPEIHRRR